MADLRLAPGDVGDAVVGVVVRDDYLDAGVGQRAARSARDDATDEQVAAGAAVIERAAAAVQRDIAGEPATGCAGVFERAAVQHDARARAQGGVGAVGDQIADYERTAVDNGRAGIAVGGVEG